MQSGFLIGKFKFDKNSKLDFISKYDSKPIFII